MFDEGSVFRNTSIAFTVISPLFVVIRFACRVSKHGLGWDDWTLVPGLIFGLVLNALHIVAVDYGFGRNVENQTERQERMMFTTVWLAHVFFKVGVSFVKASICLLYLRIFTNRTFRILTWTTLVLSSVFGLIISLGTIFKCRPISASWDPVVHDMATTSCASTEALWYTSGTFFIITDVILVALPIPLIYKIQRPTKDKVLLYMIFSIGVFVTATSIVKMTSVDIQATKKDITLFLGAALWSMIELHVGIVCACLPTLRASIAHFLPVIITISRRSPSSASAYSGSGTDAEYKKDVNGNRKWSQNTTSTFANASVNASTNASAASRTRNVSHESNSFESTYYDVEEEAATTFATREKSVMDRTDIGTKVEGGTEPQVTLREMRPCLGGRL